MTTTLLAGRVALVTGASRSMGAAIARHLGAHGAAVAVNYRRDAEAAARVVADIEAAGSPAVAVGGDATDPAAIAGIVEAARAALGDVDLLVANTIGDTSGLVERLHARRPLLDQAEAIRNTAATQLDAVLHVCRHVVPGMRRRGGGTIVMIGASGSRGTSGAGSAEILVAKAAQDALARCLAAELGPEGIRVNTVAPGFVPTDANAGPQQATMVTTIGERTPRRQVSSVEDVADAVVALSSDLTRGSTGAFLAVDGGMTMV